ncbi:septal ring lytic transglycosylase RlpA family protein [Altererythrobacter sp. FM1]|uniref:septal ring lytic transglycosylase RlpA family protein n=1 Tax=Tsuneonella flava TaxID=2055955 RepID=UPI000C80BD9A|nr:septal ring lytic transglycosylase RlpA family protein [Tsuneonella flava]ROT94232.1 septal ring lytic transglycosylase RlpA family protein [Altererythrobacter sp. FM1]
MDGICFNIRHGALRGFAFAVALALPASLSAPVRADDSADAFAANFAGMAKAAPGFAAASHAVNLSSFTPPVEDQAADDGDDDAGQVIGSGVASYYGRKFNGRPTASGERFDMNALTAAHKTLPFGSKVRVTNPRNGKSVVVRINDRGPYSHGRLIDLSRAAASEIGIVGPGSGTVELALLDD